MYVRRATRAADPAYSCVQARTALRNRRQKRLQQRVTLPGNDPASTTEPDSPAYPACSGPSRRSKPVHPPSTRDAPSIYFSQTLATGNAVTIPGPLHRTQRIRSVPASTRTTRRKSRSACHIARIGDESIARIKLLRTWNHK
jgi:hypothetical protein